MNTNITISESMEQMCKGQDQTYSGSFIDETTGEEGEWAMVTDGHGTNKCIQFLRSIPKELLNKIIGSSNPVENLANHVNKLAFIGKEVSSGATMCLVKVYKNRIVTINCGDSQVAVYKNEELQVLTEEDNYENLKERQRVERNIPGIKFEKSCNIEIVSDKKMCGIPCHYIIYPNGTKLAPTQVLGHGGVTGYDPNICVVPYGAEDSIQVVIGSDGFWDMVLKENTEEMASFSLKTSDELVQFAVGRWLQEWDMYQDKSTNIFETCSYQRNDCDDVCVVKIDITSSYNSTFINEIPIITNNIENIFTLDNI